MRCVAQFVLVLATGGVDGVAELLGDVTLAGTLFFFGLRCLVACFFAPVSIANII